MEHTNWINAYLTLKKVNPVNPFTVPEGYFDSLGERIVSNKNLEELKDSESSGGFSVPGNYFDDLASNIQSRINIEAVVNNEESGFALPEAYFTNLEQQIQSRINIEAAVNKEENSFAVPEGYFTNLEQQIQSRIFIEETLNKEAEHFTVPESYFNKLNADILNKTVYAGNPNRGAVVRRLFASTAFKYATAACFAIFLGAGILLSELSSANSDHKHTYLHKQLSGISVEDIKDYLQLNVDAGETQQTVVTEGTPVDNDKLQNALQDKADSTQ